MFSERFLHKSVFQLGVNSSNNLQCSIVFTEFQQYKQRTAQLLSNMLASIIISEHWVFSEQSVLSFKTITLVQKSPQDTVTHVALLL